MASPLTGFSVVVDVPVRWGDMDAFGHVNNTVYFQYFESARIAYFETVGFTGEGGGIGPILHSTNCRFRVPLKYPAQTRVGARVIELNQDRFLHEYRVESGGLLVADGTGLIVAYDYKNAKKADLPAEVVARVQQRDAVQLTEAKR